MLSKLISRNVSKAALVNMAQRGFRASAIVHKKPSIGDAVTILQSKVSSINQVVSTLKPAHIYNLLNSSRPTIKYGRHCLTINMNSLADPTNNFVLNRTT